MRLLHRIRSLLLPPHQPVSRSRGSTQPETEPAAEIRDGHNHQAAGDAVWYQAYNETNGTVIASRISWAGTSDERRRGLLGRTHLDRDEGVYIVPTQWIHMFGMRFPIDVAFLASDGRVLHMHHGLKPNRLSRLVWKAEGALELAEGALHAADVSPGDIITLRSANNMSQ